MHECASRMPALLFRDLNPSTLRASWESHYRRCARVWALTYLMVCYIWSAEFGLPRSLRCWAVAWGGSMSSAAAWRTTVRVPSVTVRIVASVSLALASVLALPVAAAASAGDAAVSAGQAGRFSVETAYSAVAPSLADVSCSSTEDCVAVGKNRRGGGSIVATRNGGAD